ncbi:MAG: porin [Balneolaceae bacterium]|nr:porin [Balneolaceae bacterium]
MKTSVLLGALLLVWASGAIAQQSQTDNSSISGLVYSDYYWMADHYDENVKGEHGFWFRRVYFTYDRQISDAFSARFRLEGNSAGDFNSSTNIIPEIKDLYLRWQSGQHQIEAGISSTPTFSLVDEVWGYRSVEKSPLDLLDFASSRDIGLSFKGELDREGRINYHLMIGNGNSNRSEFNKGKKLMIALSYELTENVVVEVYGDYEDRTENQARGTIQGFAGYQSEPFNAGVLFAHQTRYNMPAAVGEQAQDRGLEIASVFTNFQISESANGYLRLDKTFDPFSGLTDNDYFPISDLAAATILIAGVDLELAEDVSLMPNIESAFYAENDDGVSPGNTLIPRLTLHYDF